MFKICTLSFDVEDGYPEFERDCEHVSFFSGIGEEAKVLGIPLHRLTVYEYTDDTHDELGNLEEVVQYLKDRESLLQKQMSNQKGSN